MSDPIKIKNCPFCGHIFDRIGYNGQPATAWYVGCVCGARGSLVEGPMEHAANKAIELWNIRKEGEENEPK
jgi:hypothetical protein